MKLIRTILALSVVTIPVLAESQPDRKAHEDAFHFENRISPILAKEGCSAAECHGSATGQGGFKLSLFADNPRLDYEAITQELGGRRIDYANPTNSLVLRKPSRHGVKHKGGRIFRGHEFAYRELVEWIQNGAPYDSGEEETLKGIELRPSNGRFNVVANFQAGSSTVQRDVTQLALLSSSNEQVGTVDDLGHIKVTGPGETWIFARYGKFNARSVVRRPFGEKATTEKVVHPLDRAWHTYLNELGLRPAQPASPEILVRRIYFDLMGRPPSPYELSRCEQLPGESRIPRTVDQLIATPEFDRVFARHLGEFFEIPEAGRDPRNAAQRNTRLRKVFQVSMTRKTSIAELTRTVLTDPVGQESWKHLTDPRDRAEYVGRTMLGMRIGCARCHNHPLDRWTNAEHLQFSAYFSDPRPAPGGGMMAGKFFVPESGTEVPPRLLPLDNSLPPEGLTPEETLAWFILDSGNKQFARNIVNRVLGVLVGTPLVDLPDDHRITNPSVSEPMLDLLADRFVKSGSDLRQLVRFIVTSRLYAASSLPPSEENVSGDPQLRYFARRKARPLTPSQYKNAVEFVLGTKIERPSPPDSPLAQQLYILNSGLIQEGLKSPDNHIDAILDFQPQPSEQLVELYRLILSRKPKPEERDYFLPLLQLAKQNRGVVKDLAAALLASREFGSLR